MKMLVRRRKSQAFFTAWEASPGSGYIRFQSEGGSVGGLYKDKFWQEFILVRYL